VRETARAEPHISWDAASCRLHAHLARGDIHRDFETKTHIDEARGGPLHSVSPCDGESLLRLLAVPKERLPVERRKGHAKTIDLT
jgi:hypothetical protein